MIYKKHDMNIYVNKRDDILIKNNFRIIKNNNFSDTFHIVCYYISNNICKIIIRRTDSDEGWGQNIIISIEDIENNNYEEYSIGSSNSNIKILELYLKIRLFKTIYEEYKIPKIIIQTYDEAIYKNNIHYNIIISLIELNPEYEYKFFDNNDCLKFINENYDKEIFYKYNSIKTYKKKSELFRYCYLYLNGGCYINSNINLLQPIHKIINNNDNFVVSEGNNNRIIMTYPKNELLYKLINNFNIEIFHNFHQPTASQPDLNLVYSISEDHVRYRKDETIQAILGAAEKDNNIVNTRTSSLHKIINNINFKVIDNIKIHNILINENMIYKRSIKINNYIFQIFQSIIEDEFEIFNLKNNIYYIQRIDMNNGWAQNIILRIFNDLENINLEINIESSNKNKKIFIIG
jgi:hypothetical protein